MKVEKKSELIGRGGVYRRPVRHTRRFGCTLNYKGNSSYTCTTLLTVIAVQRMAQLFAFIFTQIFRPSGGFMQTLWFFLMYANYTHATASNYSRVVDPK